MTPSQLAELEHVEQPLIEAWLVALASTANLHSPTGWFLAGVRSGRMPGAVPDNEREQAVRLAERWVRNAGLYEPDEPSLLDALFGEHGRLRELAGDDVLRRRMLELWRSEQPRAEQAHAEQLARAERWVHTHKLGTERTSHAHAPQTAQQSQTSMALTAVSADTDPDADIPW